MKEAGEDEYRRIGSPPKGVGGDRGLMLIDTRTILESQNRGTVRFHGDSPSIHPDAKPWRHSRTILIPDSFQPIWIGNAVSDNRHHPIGFSPPAGFSNHEDIEKPAHSLPPDHVSGKCRKCRGPSNARSFVDFQHPAGNHGDRNSTNLQRLALLKILRNPPGNTVKISTDRRVADPDDLVLFRKNLPDT